jgi:hypothetical protein
MMMKCPKKKTEWCAGCDHELPHEEKSDCKKAVNKYCSLCVPDDDEREETREEMCLRHIKTAKCQMAKYQNMIAECQNMVNEYKEKANRWNSMVEERESELKSIRSANVKKE